MCMGNDRGPVEREKLKTKERRHNEENSLQADRRRQLRVQVGGKFEKRKCH